MIRLGNRSRHPSDEELLLVADRESSPRRAAKVREHLAQCAPCNARMTALESTLADFVSLHEQTLLCEEPTRPRFRNALQAELARAGRRSGEREAAPSSVPWVRQLAGACIAFVVVAGSLWLMRGIALRQVDKKASEQMASALPRKRLTPGATRTVHLDDLCHRDDEDQDPPVNISLEQQVLAEYGVPVAARHGYQLDYLIAPELGGTADIRNLWPQPYSSTSWNAQVKDDLENHLHQMVCAGKLPLATAQAEIATDWIATYKREFRTDTPLTNAAALDPLPDYATPHLSPENLTLHTPLL